MSYLQNPLVLAAVAILSLLVLALIVLIILRSRGRNQAVDETRVRQELEAMERENQFATAVERLEYRKSSTETAADVAGLFADHLSLPLYAIYAGREGEDRLTNILPKTALLDTRPLVRLPDSLPSSVAREFRQPQTARVSALTGLQAGELPAPPSAEGQETAAGLQQQNSGGESQENAAQGSVAVLPWRGSFGWGGLMIARAGEGFNAEALSHYREPLARLSNALAVALEMERERGEAAANDWRVLGVLEFSRSVVSALDKPSPLAIINSHLPGLFRADSAAIWSVDRNTAMVRAIATYGLGATEFLPLPMGQGLAGIVAQSGQPLAVEDAPSDPRCLFPRETQEAGIVSYLGAPMIVEGNTIGVVEVHTSDRRVWSEGDARLLASVASLLAEVVRGTETRSNKLRVENAYLGLSEALQRLRSHDEVLAAVVEVLGHALGVSRAFVIEFNELGQPEAVEYEYRLPEVASVKGTAFREDLLNRVMAASANGGPILIEDSR
ncbi:MAG TPA: GAF domain-containing protein, partial [Blastocatellia bacterium]|nr:GAF domain-containing protein [Blastocatellia bacterium]